MKLGCAEAEPPRPISVQTAGISSSLHEVAQFVAGIGRDNAAARIDERPLGFPDHLRGAADLAGVAFGEDFIAGQMDGRHRRVVGPGLENILSDIDQHGTGPAAGGNIESFVNGLRQVRDVLDQKIVLGGRARDAESVGLLKRVAADQLAGHLAGDGDDRDGIHHGVDQDR